MKLSAILAVFSALCLQLVSAQIRLTEPLGESSWNAAKPPAVQWRPTKGASLTELGSLQISLWGGSTEMRTSLLEIGTVDATVRRLPVPALAANLGPTGDYYFIRMYSSAKNKTYTSGKFSITGLTGAFNATMQAELAKGAVETTASANSSAPNVQAGSIASGRASSNVSTTIMKSTSAGFRGAEFTPFATLAALGAVLYSLSLL